MKDNEQRKSYIKRLIEATAREALTTMLGTQLLRFLEFLQNGINIVKGLYDLGPFLGTCDKRDNQLQVATSLIPRARFSVL